MSQDAPRPVKAAPEWVGDSEEHRDISLMSDRAIAVASFDAVLKLSSALRHNVSAQIKFQHEWEEQMVSLLRELPNHERRIRELELGPMREEIPSSHEWNEELRNAGVILSQRVKDPKDRLDSQRAREIAREVIEGAKTADDARAFRALKSKGWSVALEILKLVIVALLGAAAAHYGLHVG